MWRQLPPACLRRCGAATLFVFAAGSSYTPLNARKKRKPRSKLEDLRSADFLGVVFVCFVSFVVGKFLVVFSVFDRSARKTGQRQLSPPWHLKVLVGKLSHTDKRVKSNACQV